MSTYKNNDPLATEETLEADPEDLILEYFWYGTVNGEAFDGDLEDLW